MAVADIIEGEMLTHDTVRISRRGDDLAARHVRDVLSRRALQGVPQGTPIN